jgi:hypothetical protein
VPRVSLSRPTVGHPHRPHRLRFLAEFSPRCAVSGRLTDTHRRIPVTFARGKQSQTLVGDPKGLASALDSCLEAAIHQFPKAPGELQQDRHKITRRFARYQTRIPKLANISATGSRAAHTQVPKQAPPQPQ